MPPKTFAWDPAEALDTPEMQAEYLSLVFADGNASEIARALGIVARAGGLPSLIESDEGDPKLSTLLRTIRALGMRLKVTPASDDA